MRNNQLYLFVCLTTVVQHVYGGKILERLWENATDYYDDKRSEKLAIKFEMHSGDVSISHQFLSDNETEKKVYAPAFDLSEENFVLTDVNNETHDIYPEFASRTFKSYFDLVNGSISNIAGNNDSFVTDFDSTRAKANLSSDWRTLTMSAMGFPSGKSPLSSVTSTRDLDFSSTGPVKSSQDLYGKVNEINHCAIVIPDSLNHRVDMTFSLLVNMSGSKNILKLFERYLRLALGHQDCNSVVRTSFIVSQLFRYSWINASADSSRCNDEAIDMLRNKIFNSSELSDLFVESFRPIFKLEAVSIQQFGLCAVTIKHHHTVFAFLVIVGLCFFPCVFLLASRLLCSFMRGHSKRKKAKNLLKSRQPVVFRQEISICVPIDMTHASAHGINNSAFCKNDEV